MQNFPTKSVQEHALEDPNAAKVVEDLVQEVYNQNINDPKVKESCLVWGSFARGVEYGAGLAFRGLVRMSNETSSALARVREVLPLLGDEEHKAVAAALDYAYERTREARGMARYLAVSNASTVYRVPAETFQAFLAGPQSDMEYTRLGMMCALSQPDYFTRYMQVSRTPEYKKMECRCTACLTRASLEILLSGQYKDDYVTKSNPSEMMQGFGRLVMDQIREAIDMVDSGDIRTGHEEGEPGQTAEALIADLLRRGKGE